MDPLVQSAVTIASSILASGGLWTYLQRRDSRKSATVQLMLGLAHNEIIRQCMMYVERGWLTKDEYEDLMKYLWGPYSAFGGNGLAEKMIEEVKRLPISTPFNRSVIPVEVTTKEG